MTESKTMVPLWAWRSATIVLWIIALSLLSIGQKSISAQLEEIDKTLTCHAERITTLEQQRISNTTRIEEMINRFSSMEAKIDKLLENTAELRGQQKGKP